MPNPCVTVDLNKLAHNTKLVGDMCGRAGLSVMGVTKAFCADPRIAGAMLAGGLEWLADSRVQNIERLRQAGITAPICLLRLPMLSETDEVVRLAEMSQVSEVVVAEALARSAVKQGRRHKITLMVDLGDLREGLLPQNILRAAETMSRLPGLELYGLGVNFACYGGVVPTPAKLSEMLALADFIRQKTGVELPLVSGGNSVNLHLLPDGIPRGITHLRIGEGILLGRETTVRAPIAGAHLDVFALQAEIIELQDKPSVPDGKIGQDAFGNTPVFTDRGIRRRAILAIGRQDVNIDGLEPVDPGIAIIGASSDHLLVDVSDAGRTLAVGDVVNFHMRYGALISAMMSPHVDTILN